MSHIIINAENLILGRMAAFVAKKALLGNKVDIVNCDKAIVTGSKKQVQEFYNTKFQRGAPLMGPYVPRAADRMVRRTVRGMLPYKKAKGKEAFDRVMCYIGVPDEFKEGMTTVPGAEASKLPNIKYVQLGQITKLIGAR
jgi:large subunit ribosomal protein L13